MIIKSLFILIFFGLANISNATPKITGFSLVNTSSGKPLLGFNPISKNSYLPASASTLSRLALKINKTTAAKNGVVARINGRSYLIKKRPYRINNLSRFKSSSITITAAYANRYGKPISSTRKSTTLQLDQNKSSGPSPVSRTVPAEVVTYKSQMLTKGRSLCNLSEINSLNTWEGNVWYYDGIRVFYQIADYTGDSFWNTCAAYVRDLYTNYVITNKGQIGGWRLFPQGLYEDYRRTSNQRSREALLLLANASPFSKNGGEISFEASRETAYIMESYIFAEKAGAGRNPNLSQSVNFAISHIDQWVNGEAPYVKPFMMGLTFEALIRYHELTGDIRAEKAVKKGADWLWNNLWNSQRGSFPYINCRKANNNPECTQDLSGEGQDLNQLIAPAYAWLYFRTKDTSYLDKADKIFSFGVKNAYLGNGKHFNQQYRWGFDYLKWRS